MGLTSAGGNKAHVDFKTIPTTGVSHASAFIQDFSHTYILPQETVEETVPVSGSSAGVNALGLVVFSMCFGLVIGNMKEQGQALRDFFDCLNEAIMRLVAIVIWSVKALPQIFEAVKLPPPWKPYTSFIFN